MKLETKGHVLHVNDIDQLTTLNATSFRDEVRAAISDTIHTIELDMSQTRFADSSGLGALLAIFVATKKMDRDISLHIFNPRPSLEELFQLSQLSQLWQVHTTSHKHAPAR